MSDWYLDSGLNVLRNQLRVKHPGIVIGTISNASHSSRKSDHNPDPDGSVDAIDPMLSGTYTAEMAREEIDNIIDSRDERVAYLIFEKRIISSTVSPWTWRTYTGNDPHTGHWHLSVNDLHHGNLNPWRIESAMLEHTYLNLDAYSIGEVKYGQNDDDYAGYHYVARAQKLLQYQGETVTVDGIYGDQTKNALKNVCGGDGKIIALPQWSVLMGLSTRTGI